ncbi:MAG TPA: DUF302 domain-containing protein [Gemmatimonadaceae bacterium]
MNADNGIVTVPSQHSVDETINKLQDLLRTNGVKVFALIDHDGEAKAAGLEMPPTKLLIFGNPAGGTPLMLASPSIALDLPLKLLVAEGADGRAHISYNDPAYLQRRHGLPASLVQTLAVVKKLAAAGGE